MISTSNTIRLATVFSGIGAVEQALLKQKVPYSIAFACDNGENELKISKQEIESLIEEKDIKKADIPSFIKQLYQSTGKVNWMKKSYLANYPLNEESWFDDVRFIDGNKFKNKIDLFVGGSPCQSFSAIGKRAGLEDARGTLFYEYARLVKEMQPKVFIYENVPGMLTHDKGNTWKVISEIFYSLGYDIHKTILNASDYGIPQNRRRLFVVGFKKTHNDFHFPEPIELKKTMFDYLEKNPEAKHYLGKKGFEFVTNPKYANRARVNKRIIQTQKANQQFNWNGDFVFEELSHVKNNAAIMERAHVGEWNGKKGVIRQLTHRECLNLMGFSKDFKIIPPNVWAYRQAGNSIVVNVLEHILKEIFKVEFNG